MWDTDQLERDIIQPHSATPSIEEAGNLFPGTAVEQLVDSYVPHPIHLFQILTGVSLLVSGRACCMYYVPSYQWLLCIRGGELGYSYFDIIIPVGLNSLV